TTTTASSSPCSSSRALASAVSRVTAISRLVASGTPGEVADASFPVRDKGVALKTVSSAFSYGGSRYRPALPLQGLYEAGPEVQPSRVAGFQLCEAGRRAHCVNEDWFHMSMSRQGVLSAFLAAACLVAAPGMAAGRSDVQDN